jgi:uncharacterized protein
LRSEATRAHPPNTVSLSPSPRNHCDATGPLAPTDRIDAIDALRGIALFGVLIVNLVTEFHVSIFEQFLSQRPAQSALDRGLEEVLMLLFAQKALSLFSLLFGLGLAIQFDRLNGNPRRLTLLLRRIAVLLPIGLVHLFLIWDGDILTEYALAGFLILPFLFGPRWLVATASAVCVGLYLMSPLQHPLPFPSQSWIVQHVAEAIRVYGGGSFAEILAFRIRELPAIATLHLSILARTIALFLFGVSIWRTGLVRNVARHTSSLFACAATFLVAGIAFGAVAQGWALSAAPSPAYPVSSSDAPQ